MPCGSGNAIATRSSFLPARKQFASITLGVRELSFTPRRQPGGHAASYQDPEPFLTVYTLVIA